ncbi:MAG: alanine racemase [Halothiobacillaceae bacterium]|nr:alanine racemase [Halothiobacillaceae bacterium]
MPSSRKEQLRRPLAHINLDALRHNLEVVRSHAEGAKVFAVVKADAYGHGMLACAQALRTRADGFVVSTLGEADALRKSGITQRIIVLQGFMNVSEARFAARLMLEPVLHQAWQVELIEQTSLGLPLSVWLKIDTGMHRIGIPPEQAQSVHARLVASKRLRQAPGLMTHFARADEADAAPTQQQLAVFHAATEGLAGERSVANSAGLLSGAARGALGDVVRPGIALYGSNPLEYGSAVDLGLKPVMRLETCLLAIKPHAQGDAVGYGARFVCPEDMSVAVASVGYADGYPRVTPSGTPVAVNGQIARLAGRVSMDLITLDMRGVQAAVGDRVELWGESVAVDAVAHAAGTLGYELLCAAGRASPRTYVSEQDSDPIRGMLS